MINANRELLREALDLLELASIGGVSLRSSATAERIRQALDGGRSVEVPESAIPILLEISGNEGMCLIGDPNNFDATKSERLSYQCGSGRAFDQCAALAKKALALISDTAKASGEFQDD
jgi:hypothetical protein